MQELLLDKIREAEQCDDPDISQEYLDGYVNGLKMAIVILKEYGMWKE